MAHNIRIPAVNSGIYIAKSGSDNNAGTDPNAPAASMAAFLATSRRYYDSSTVCTGVYYWLDSQNVTHGNLVADGTVKLLGDGQTQMSLCESELNCSGFYFDQFAGFYFRRYIYGNPVVYNKCIFKVLAPFAGQQNSFTTGGVNWFDCIFFNVYLPGGGGDTYSRCLFFGCTINNISSLDSCYIDPNSSLTTASGANVVNNNIDPDCNTAAGRGLSLAGAAFSTVSPGGGISQPPLFNSLAKEDFNLRANSRHITNGIGPAQYRFANSYYAEFSGAAGDEATVSNTKFRPTGTGALVGMKDITSSASGQGFELNAQQGLVLQANTSALGRGGWHTGRIPFADVADEMTVMYLKAGLNFNTSYPALESQFNQNQPEIFNNNVPVVEAYTAGAKGRTPSRLTYLMRWSTKPSPNDDLANVTDWITGTNFILFEWNSKPLWNPATGLGNGHPDFDPAAAQAIQCTFYQLAGSLRNDYYR